ARSAAGAGRAGVARAREGRDAALRAAGPATVDRELRCGRVPHSGAARAVDRALRHRAVREVTAHVEVDRAVEHRAARALGDELYLTSRGAGHDTLRRAGGEVAAACATEGHHVGAELVRARGAAAGARSAARA